MTLNDDTTPTSTLAYGFPKRYRTKFGTSSSLALKIPRTPSITLLDLGNGIQTVDGHFGKTFRAWGIGLTTCLTAQLTHKLFHAEGCHWQNREQQNREQNRSSRRLWAIARRISHHFRNSPLIMTVTRSTLIL